jgi:phage gp16-like protein
METTADKMLVLDFDASSGLGCKNWNWNHQQLHTKSSDLL